MNPRSPSDEQKEIGRKRSRDEHVDGDSESSSRPLSRSRMMERGYLLSTAAPGAMAISDDLLRFPADHGGVFHQAGTALEGDREAKNDAAFFDGLWDEKDADQDKKGKSTALRKTVLHQSRTTKKPLSSTSSSSSLEIDNETKNAPLDVFSESVRRLSGERTNNCGAFWDPKLVLRHKLIWTVKEAMDIIEWSNNNSNNNRSDASWSCQDPTHQQQQEQDEDLSMPPLPPIQPSNTQNPIIILTLTSFPFRIVHASDSLLAKSGKDSKNETSGCCLGAPLSDCVSSLYPSGRNLMTLTPNISKQGVLMGHQLMQGKLIPVVHNHASASSSRLSNTLMYHAIVLQDATHPSRISPLPFTR